jgi:hypothetical protein
MEFRFWVQKGLRMRRRRRFWSWCLAEFSAISGMQEPGRSSLIIRSDDEPGSSGVEGVWFSKNDRNSDSFTEYQVGTYSASLDQP